MRWIYRIGLPLALLTVVLSYQNCSRASFEVNQARLNELGYGDAPTCDPLGNGGQTQIRNGLIGRLSYVPVDQQNPANLQYLEDVLGLAVRAPTTVFLSQVSVPTRRWSDGFLVDGNYLADSSGAKLVEYFSLSLDSVIKVPAAEAGDYQFAVVSDDGAVLSLRDSNGSPSAILAGKFDKIHSTRSDCGTGVVHLDDNGLPVNLIYYQGPRDAIAATLLYRKVNAQTNLQGPGCNVVSPWDFFVSPNGGTTPYAQMVADGWQIVPANRFFLPNEAPNNPCVN